MSKKTKSRSIAFKMSLYLSLLVIFLMAGVNLGNYYNSRAALNKEAIDKGWILVQSNSAVSAGYISSGATELLRDQMYKVRANGDVSFVEVLNPAGKVLAHTDSSQVGKIVSFTEGFPTQNIVGTYKDEKSKTQGYDFVSPIIVSAGGTPLGYFRLGLDTSRYDRLLEDMILNMFFISLAAILASLLLARVMSKRILRTPIEDLKAATEHIATGDFAHRVPVREMDELGSLASAFNSMTGHLANLFLSVRTSAAELSKSSQVIMNRSEEFRVAAENARWDKHAGKPGTQDEPDVDKKKQLEAIQEISLSAKKMSRLVDRLNSLSLQFKL
ncbi:MAG: HAMP domain-containing protein [Desulfocucumaceae bacterium]